MYAATTKDEGNAADGCFSAACSNFYSRVIPHISLRGLKKGEFAREESKDRVSTVKLSKKRIGFKLEKSLSSPPFVQRHEGVDPL
jgi:hypothetical protein